MAGGIKRTGAGTNRGRALNTGVANQASRQGLLKINQLQFPVVTAWTDYTPSVDWTNTTAVGKWRRVGDSIELDVILTFSGAPSGSTLHIGLPSGLAVDTNKLPSNRHLLGNALIYDGTSYLQGAVEYDTANTFRLLVIRESAAQTHNLFTVSPTSPATIGSGDIIHAHWITPILGFDANGFGTIEEIIGSSIIDASRLIKMGRTDGSNPLPGEIGERFESKITTPTNFPTTNTTGDITSITLPPGVWDISAVVFHGANGATVTRAYAGIGTVSGNSQTGMQEGDNTIDLPIALSGTRGGGGSIPAWRVNITSSTTYYLKILGTYSVATPQYQGRISAVRVA